MLQIKRKFTQIIKSPVDNASWFSKLFFIWMNTLLFKAESRSLTERDIPPVPLYLSGSCINESLQLPKRQLTVSAILHSCWKHFCFQFVNAFVTRLIADCLLFMQPYLIQTFISTISQYKQTIDFNNQTKLFLIALSLFLIRVAIIVGNNHYFRLSTEIGIALKTVIISNIYQKLIQKSASNHMEKLPNLTKLLSIEITKLEESSVVIHTVLTAPILISIACTLLIQYLQVAALPGIAVLVTSISIQITGVRISSKYVKSVMAMSEKRLRLFEEMIRSIKIIKVLSWEKYFISKIVSLRQQEMFHIANVFKSKAITDALLICMPVCTQFCTYSTYAFYNGQLNAATVYSSLIIFSVLRNLFAPIPQALSIILDAYNSILPITKILKINDSTINSSVNPHLAVDIALSEASFSWGDKNVLNNISCQIPPGSLVGIVGRIGTGKTSLLHAVMGNMFLTHGVFQLKTNSFAYVPQQSWLLNGSIKENILFFSNYNELLYHEVLKSCAFGKDLQQLVNSDNTNVGDEGVSLSGGQKQRIGLARAAYSNKDIICMDDPLSALDSQVRNVIFDVCIKTVMKGKTRLMVTNQIHLLDKMDFIVYMENGYIFEQGTFNQLLSKQTSYVKEMYNNYNNCILAATSPNKSSNTSNKNQQRRFSFINNNTNSNVSDEMKAKNFDSNHSTNGLKDYIKSVGNVPYFAAMALFVFVMVAIVYTCDRWLAFWTSDHFQQSNIWYCSGYAIIISCLVVWSCVVVTFIANRGIFASSNSHKKSLDILILASVPYYDKVSMSYILNRFGKDQSVIDLIVTNSMNMCLFFCANCAGCIIMIGVFNKPFFSVVPLILGSYYMVQNKFRHCTSYLKQTNSSIKPLLLKFAEQIITGALLIRAFNKNINFLIAANGIIDKINKYQYLLQSSLRWLGQRVEFLGALTVLFTMLFIISQVQNIDTGLAGLSVTYAASLNSLLISLLKWFVEVEIQSESLNRSCIFDESIELENESTNLIDNAHWPYKGFVEFIQVTFSYIKSGPVVLNDVSFNIPAGTKLGVVGRSGAGKSSLVAAIYRMVDLSSGSICIDGVNIKDVKLSTLRSSLAIIPQEPILFTGTVKFNIDPFDQHNDEEIKQILEQVQLQSFVSNLERQINHFVDENDPSFTMGRKSQLCIARALIKNSKFLILDEATASMDLETETIFSSNIKQISTSVLSIAHRLNTVMDFESVLVLNFGKVAEWNAPQKLLANTNSIFHSMYFNSKL